MNLNTMAASVKTPPRLTDLTSRIRGEYLEMPGMCLTLSQAAKLWNVDRDTCKYALESLMQAGFLYKSGETFLRKGRGD